MEQQQSQPLNPARNFDGQSMERSKNFVVALQELKNLGPQLYTAAEYCEKSYLNSEHKQMVLDNLKDYTVKALVNAIDHLGTVAYKLNDLLDQQALDVSSMELSAACLNQRFLTCQIYTDKEGMRQQQLLAIIPRHHKHYTLPKSMNKKVHFSPQIQTDVRQSHIQTIPRTLSAGTAAKTLSWHMATETKSTLKGTRRVATSNGDIKTSGQISGVFHLSNDEESVTTTTPTFGGMQKDSLEGTRPQLTGFRSFDNQKRREIANAPTRSKSVLSAFFPRQKIPKVRTS